MFRTKFYPLLILLVFTAACGGCDDPDPNLCDDVDCERGICDLGSGECVNAVNCSGEDDSCVAGFACEDNVCVTSFPCNTDGSCDRGVCEDGACINPDACDAEDDCLPGSVCGVDGTCSSDPCDDVTCDRGVCSAGIGECVNAGVCTRATEATDCLDDNICVDGQCETETSYCDDLACDRGVCSTEERACIDAPDCAGSDMNCTSGSFCDTDNTCKPNLCDTNNVDCPRGVCDSNLGTCVDADPCAAETDCTDGKLCVSGACVPTVDACAVGGCPGNQTCAYDAQTLSATCEEPATCATSLDCVDPRVCNATVCGAAAACMDDALEPNDAAGAETSYVDTQLNGSIQDLTLCGQDVDLFSFNTQDDPELFGEFSVNLSLVPEDVGLGVVTVELVNDAGTAVRTVTNEENGVQTGTVNLVYTIDVLNQGLYTIRVSGAGLSSQGIRYELTADILDGALLAACTAATDLPTGTPVSGDTNTAMTAAAQTCADLDGTLNENIWALTITESSFATITVIPSATGNLTVSLRETCSQDQSQVACGNEASAGEVQRINATLEPGEYFVVIEAEDAAAGGNYVINVDLVPLVCTPADNTCLAADTANVCNETGTAFDMVTCSNGCDMAAGRCERDAGDICGSAIPVTGSFDTVIDWLTLTDDYQLGSGSLCVPSAATSTDLEDYVMTVTVPADNVLYASSPRVSGEYIAMYIVTDCADLEGTCLAGANAGNFVDEEIAYTNDTGADQDVFLIIDRGTAGFTDSPTPISVEITPAVCVPGERRCILNRESQLCNSRGTAFDETTICENGCDAVTNECIVPVNDLCGGALPLPTDGTIVTGDIGILNDSYDPPSFACTGDSTSGPDASYVLSNLQVGEVVTVTMTSEFGGAPWVADSCVADVIGACVGGSDSTTGTNDTEVITFAVQTAGDYYVIADSDLPTSSTGTYTLSATVSPPECNPGEVLGCSVDAMSLEVCDSIGQIQSVACAGGCANDACATPGGDLCQDAIVLTPNATVQTLSDDFSGFDADLELPTGTTGACFFTSPTDEDDVFYSVLVPAGNTFTAELDAGSTSMRFYAFEGCDVNTCFGNLGKTGDNTIEFFAPVDTQITLVVDSINVTSLDWDLEYSMVPTPGQICQPNTTTCSSGVLDECGADGQFSRTLTCVNGCDGNYCADDIVNSDSCTTAPDVSGGGVFLVDLADYTDTANPDCADGDGVDAQFQVTVPAGNILKVTALNYNPSTSEQPTIYVYTDCLNSATTCIASAANANPGELVYTSPTTQTLFVGIDNESTNAEEPIAVSFEVLPPECVVGQAPVCNAAGDGLTYCDGGLFANYECGGQGVCANDACGEPSGDFCFDSIVLANVAGPTTIDGSQPGFDTPSSWPLNRAGEFDGGCFFEITSTSSREQYYAIDLAAGDLLDIELDSVSSTAIAFARGCEDPADCIRNSAFESLPIGLNYYATVAERIHVIFVSKFSTTSSFEFDYTVTPNFGGTCAPSTFECVDANTIATCDSDGNLVSNYLCANGCVDGRCVLAQTASDSCSGAPTVGDGAHLVQYFTNATDTINMGTACFNDDTPGKDSFVAVDVLANDILTVSTTAYNDFDDPAIYFITDCLDPDNTCLAGVANNADSQSVTYQSPIDQRIIIGWDAEFTNDDAWRSLDVSVQSPNCVPGAFTNVCNPAGDAFVYCDDTGFQQEYSCGSVAGDCDAATARCLAPIGEVCLDAFNANPAVNGTPEVIVGTLDQRVDDFSLQTGNQCTGSLTPGGDDAYVVDLTAGQTLTASLISTDATPEDVALYISTDCSNLPSSCVGGSDMQPAGATPELATYTATVDETVYIVVDSFFANSDGAYELSVNVQ